VSGTADDELLVLHQALLDGDVTAPALLAEQLLPLLGGKLRPAWSGLTDPQILESAIGFSVAKYLRNPETYDPSGRSLVNYLAMDIDGDVKNELKKRQPVAMSGEVIEQELVEVGIRERNLTAEDEALDGLDPFDLPQETVAAARRQLAQLSPRDRELAQLVVDELRSYAVWADKLGITHLPLDDQVREVKRNKDRIKKKLERMGDEIG
jgi:hypothetical protein